MVDTESDPTKAAELASKLILGDKVDLMVVMHTPDTVNLFRHVRTVQDPLHLWTTL
jgi:hypothetical protein